MYLTRTLALTAAFSLVAAAQAQNLDRAGQSATASSAAGAGYYPTPLYRMNDVVRSLNLNPDQLERLTTAGSNMQSRYRGSLEDLARLNAPDRRTRIIELRTHYTTDWDKAASGILKEDQMNRYRQLQLQYDAFSSFNDPAIQKRLNLTPDQIRLSNEANAWSQQQWEEINKRGATDRDAGLKFYQNYQRDYQDRLNKILTPEQLKIWQGMTGDPYRFQPTFSTTRPKR